MKTRRTRLVTNWQPSKLDVATIRAEMVVVLGSNGFLPLGLPEVFSPEMYSSEEWLSPMSWHQDNGGQAALLALWSNVYPTEIRFGNGRRLLSVDGDVIVIQNDKVFHRMPTHIRKSHGRWFARTFVRDLSI